MTTDPTASGVLIAVDWGTSRCRAWLVGADGTPLEARATEDGIGRLDGGHEDAFARLAAGWPAGAPAVMAGMVGSRQGWREAAYLPCPTAIDDIGGRLLRFATGDGRPVAIVPGLRFEADGRYDVMRGEETQLAGLVRRAPGFDGLCVMPGTHAKWVRLAAGTVRGFQTFVTGELFELLATTSFLRHSVERTDDVAGAPDFARGVADVAGGLPFAAALFNVRARQLLADVPKPANYAYLSGLAIGGEIAAARATGLLNEGADIRIVGGRALDALYLAALRAAGYEAQAIDGDEAVLDGLLAIARGAGFLEGPST